VGWMGGKPATRRRHVNSVDAVIGSYLASLEIKPLVKYKSGQIIFYDSKCALSARLANAHAHAYIREGVEPAHSGQRGSRAFFARQNWVELKEKLEKSELALNNYRATRESCPGLMSVDRQGDGGHRASFGLEQGDHERAGR